MAEQISLEALAQRKHMQTPSESQIETPAQIETQIEELTPEQRSRVNEIKENIDLMDSQAAIQYGVGAQRNVSGFADNILTQIRSKDSGYVGELMTDLVVKVKEAEVDPGDEGFLDKLPFLKNASRNIKKLLQRYEKLEVQNSGMFQTILNLTRLIDKYELSVDEIHFNADLEVDFLCGNIQVKLGKKAMYDEAAAALVTILPKANELDKKMTIDMTDYTSGQRVIGTYDE